MRGVRVRETTASAAPGRATTSRAGRACSASSTESCASLGVRADLQNAGCGHREQTARYRDLMY